jgi:hypothetical protein
MRVWVMQNITTPKGIIPAGEIIDIPPAVAEKLGGKVKPVTDGKELATFCDRGGAWCSSKIGLSPCHNCGGIE